MVIKIDILISYVIVSFVLLEIDALVFGDFASPKFTWRKEGAATDL